MSNLSEHEKEIIVDFYFRCGSEERINAGRDLVASNDEAAGMYADLQATLGALDSIKYDPCPDNLAEGTVTRLKLAASAGQARLENLLAAEQKKSQQDLPVVSGRRNFWRIAEFAVAAAMILIAAGVFFPTTSNMRQIARRNRCAANLANIGAGIAGYGNDHNDALPSVSTKAGSPWWKIGDRGEKNQSNTRHVWLLVKDGYVEGENFVCPGRKNAVKTVKFSSDELRKYNDFPGRKFINYSFTFMCDKAAKRPKTDKAVFMADLNPVFERVFDKSSKTGRRQQDEFAKILIDAHMLKMMSTNHAGAGQNILRGDGSTEFKTRRIVFGDDIYTVRGTSAYTGKEVPCDKDDIFLAP